MNQKLSDRDVRYIRQLAFGTQKSAVEILKDFNLQVLVRKVQKLLRRTPNLEYKQCKHTPFLKVKYRILRGKWACSKLEDVTHDWKTILLTDKKKFKLFKPVGLIYYWNDLRRSSKVFEWVPTIDDGLIV